MKKIFIVGCKLLGLLCLYWSLGMLVQALVAFGMLFWGVPTQAQPGFYTTVGSIALAEILFGLILICRADWLSDVLRIPDTALSAGQITPAVLLYTLLIALSVFIIVMAIPEVIQGLLQVMQARAYGQLMGEAQAIALMGPLLEIVLAVIVIFRMKAMARTLLPPLKDALARSAEKHPG